MKSKRLQEVQFLDLSVQCRKTAVLLKEQEIIRTYREVIEFDQARWFMNTTYAFALDTAGHPHKLSLPAISAVNSLQHLADLVLSLILTDPDVSRMTCSTCERCKKYNHVKRVLPLLGQYKTRGNGQGEFKKFTLCPVCLTTKVYSSKEYRALAVH